MGKFIIKEKNEIMNVIVEILMNLELPKGSYHKYFGPRNIFFFREYCPI